MLRRLHIKRGMVVSFVHEGNVSAIFVSRYGIPHVVGKFTVVPAGHNIYKFTHLLHGFV